MLIRIVRMHFKEEEVENFLQIFEEVKEKIRNYPGCGHLALWRDMDRPTVFTTYSLWEDQLALEKYRHSALFKNTWGKTRVLFKEPPQAFSHYQLTEVLE